MVYLICFYSYSCLEEYLKDISKKTEKVHEISKNKEFKEKKENLVEQLDKENQVFIYNRTEQILNQPLSKIQKKI